MTLSVDGTDGPLAIERLAVSPQQLARGGDEVLIEEASPGSLQANVGKARPQPLGVSAQCSQAG